MDPGKRLSVLGFVVAAALAATGCLVEVTVDRVADPGPAFDKARKEALRYQGRRGPAHQLNLVAYDRDDGELVRISVPMWVVRELDDDELHFDGHDAVERKLRRHLRVRDLQEAGPGILLEVEERDGRVLIWLR